jgi:CHAT domain-containing protein/Tfp pilus assembly protein PilF
MILFRVAFALSLNLCASSATLKGLHSFAPLPKPLTRQTEPQATPLEVGNVIERELAGGQRHNYQIALSEGQYIKVEVKQKSIDVGVNLQLPDGRVISQYVPFGDQQELVFSWVAATSGVYRTTVYASAKAAAGRYEIRLADLHAASADDRALQQARDLFAEYVRLKHEAHYTDAQAALMRALEIREKVLGPDHLAVGVTLGFLASGYDDAGDYASAEPLHLRSLKIKEKWLGPDHPTVALELSALGGSYRERGDYVKAEEVDRRALAIFEKAQQADKPTAAGLLTSLASIYYAWGDYKNAEAYYERSRAIWEKLLGPDHFHLATSYTHLGHVAYDAGDYAKATAMFQRALTLAEKGLGPDNPKATPYANDLAASYCTTGDYDKGESLYQQALALHEKKAAMSDPAVQETLFGLARCAAAQGRISEAVTFQARASELEGRYISLNLAAGSEREKLAFLDNLTSRSFRNLSLHTRLAPNDPAALRLALTTVLRNKGRVQDAMSLSLAALRQRSGVEDRKLLDRLNEVNSRLARLVLNEPQTEAPSAYQQRIETLEEQREGLDAEISRRSAGFYERAQPITLAAVQQAIPDDAALIELAVYRPFNPQAPDNEKAYGEPHYVAYVIRKQGDARYQDLGAVEEIEARVKAWREALRDPQRKDARELGRAVDERVMQPLRAWLGETRQLLISPDGELNLIPFEALVDEQGKYLIERYAFTYLTSGRDLLRMQVARESKSPALVIADPAFGDPPAEPTAKSNRGVKPAARRRRAVAARNLAEVYFAPLGGTAQEAHAIQALFPEATLLTGKQATESALKRATAPRILHIATHGFFLQDNEPHEPPNPLPAARRPNAKARIENPLLRSGLALAGANLRQRATDNGVLTALEASGLNLWGTKLVTLSACDTGLGEVKNGEGVYGLRRALVLAGAETVVMSLWAVSDYVSREMMTDYYKGLKQGAGRGAALRQMKLAMLKRKDRQHPFYWASFIQAGEWANLDGHR